MKKCMEYRVEGRRPVGRPRKTWLESVEGDMAELEIDKENVHDRSKWRRNVNAMKRKSNPIGQWTINRYYIYTTTLPSLEKRSHQITVKSGIWISQSFIPSNKNV